jgi:hypothetical protein
MAKEKLHRSTSKCTPIRHDTSQSNIPSGERPGSSTAQLALCMVRGDFPAASPLRYLPLEL